eukprot:3763005-Rhodomonas_salina.1
MFVLVLIATIRRERLASATVAGGTMYVGPTLDKSLVNPGHTFVFGANMEMALRIDTSDLTSDALVGLETGKTAICVFLFCVCGLSLSRTVSMTLRQS